MLILAEKYNQGGAVLGETEEFQDSEAEETLSFCDLPIHDGAGEAKWDDFSKGDDQLRPSSDHEFFEFFSDLSVEMCSAEDIFLCGKIIPYSEKESLSDQQSPEKIIDEDRTTKSFFRRRPSESLNELQSSRLGVKGRLIRNNQSLDYRKLQIVTSPNTTSPSHEPANDRNLSGTCFGRFDFPIRKVSIASPPGKNRWHLFMFGLVKFPREMEIKDIRNRQSRRIPASLFQAGSVRAEKVSVRRDKAKRSWRLLRALGCTGHASAAVAASLSSIPHV